MFNRAAARLPLFKTAPDYRAFLEILQRTKLQYASSAKLYGYCLMPNHWHLIICADTTDSLSQFMRHLTRRHAVRFLADHPDRSGAVYQGRFRCVPVQDGRHLQTVLLYVDRNPVKARLVAGADQWLWSSALHHAGAVDDPLIDRLPGEAFADWNTLLGQHEPADDLTEAALKRNLPVGDADWVETLSEEWNKRRRAPGRPGKLNREELSHR